MTDNVDKLEQQAPAGDVDAMEHLAQEYLHGNFIAPDHEKPLHWA